MEATPSQFQKIISKSQNIIVISWIICFFAVGAGALTILGISNCEEIGCLLVLAPGLFAIQGLFIVAPIMIILLLVRIRRNKKILQSLSIEENKKVLIKNHLLKICLIVMILLLAGALYFPIKQYVAGREEIKKQAQEEAVHQKALQDLRQMNHLREERAKFLTEDLKNPHTIVGFSDRYINLPNESREIYMKLDNNSQLGIGHIEPSKVDELLQKLNKTELIGMKVIVQMQKDFPFTSIDAGYVCENPNFSSNTCSQDIILMGYSDIETTDGKQLDYYSTIACKTGWPNPASCRQ